VLPTRAQRRVSLHGGCRQRIARRKPSVVAGCTRESLQIELIREAYRASAAARDLAVAGDMPCLSDPASAPSNSLWSAENVGELAIESLPPDAAGRAIESLRHDPDLRSNATDTPLDTRANVELRRRSAFSDFVVLLVTIAEVRLDHAQPAIVAAGR